MVLVKIANIGMLRKAIRNYSLVQVKMQTAEENVMFLQVTFLLTEGNVTHIHHL